jgi:hypothetical protein
MGGCRSLDESLAHIPDVEARRIVRTAPGIEKGRSPEKDPGPVGDVPGEARATLAS